MPVIDTIFSVYAPPTSGLPFLSVIIAPKRLRDPLVTPFETAVEAEAFNLEMKIELQRLAKRSVARWRETAIY